jgi:uncharacterized protein
MTPVVFFVLFCLASGPDAGAFGSGAIMKGPRSGLKSPPSTREAPTSCVEIVFLESIRCYQKWISPIGGGRCGFRPSCSQYGFSAIQTEGPLVGLLMTADRLTRCNIWKRPGPDYFLLPTGKLYDPLSNNLLFEK